MVIAGFSLQNRLVKVGFLQRTFGEVDLKMSFVTPDSVDTVCREGAAEALPTTRRVAIIEFAGATLNEDDET